MCGIVGYVGEKKASPILLESIKKLEYRGYDSVGMSTVDDRINILKGVGKIDDVHKRMNFHTLEGNIGISHTRWATHGGVTDSNAHPQKDCNDQIVVVHNGIIENYLELKEELVEKGHKFSSETDTEVISHMIEDYINNGRSFREAVLETSKRLEGLFAFLVINEKEKDKIIASKHRCPLVIGIGSNENFAASDVVSFLKYTNRVIFLDDDEIAEITKNDCKVFDVAGKLKNKKISRIKWNFEEAQKTGYKHFMIKEIFEQKETIERVMSYDRKTIEKIAKMINDAYGVFFVACGTSYHACISAGYIFSKITKKHVNVFLASEFPNFSHFLTKNTLMIAVSQSGETADVMEAVRVAKEKGVKVLSLVNVMGSSLMRMSDFSLLLNAGPEICVLATKTFTSQLALIYLLAYTCAGRYEEGRKGLGDVSKKIKDVLSEENIEKIKNLAKSLKDEENIYLIGRGLSYSTTLEGALKLKEVSYIHAEGLAGGELKHGTLALIERGTPCIAIVPENESRHEILSNIMEIKARGGYIIGVSNRNEDVFDFSIIIPDVEMHPILMIIPIQLLAYYLALERGCDPDRPRNLAKSVTVK
jgi:glucosamine--fructose-6-phosphate aminotransferase (isomerizing)